MAKTNKKVPRKNVVTHEGGKASIINAEQQLRRSVLACLLFEDEFYEDGVSIANRIGMLVPEVKPEKVAALAIEARSKFNLRHVPLWLVRNMAVYPSHRGLVADTLDSVIQRADELTEFLAIYWKDGKEPLSGQVKKGLARAFPKFDEYSLAKYSNRASVVKLRDVLFLSHAKPKDEAQDALWKRLINDGLETPDTWEVAISACGNDVEKKKIEWTRLLTEKKLGALALIRNLRNMANAKVENGLVEGALSEMKVERVLPFRFIASARYAPQFEVPLEQAMFRCLEGHAKLKGKTILLVDVSGSMDQILSRNSEMVRMDAANGLAILLREVCEDITVYTFSDKIIRVPSRRGMALRDAIFNSQPHSGTYLGRALEAVNKAEDYDRLIVITDEQSHDNVVTRPKGKGYIINVASNENGVAYDRFTHINGFSEHVIDYLKEYETL